MNQKQVLKTNGLYGTIKIKAKVEERFLCNIE